MIPVPLKPAVPIPLITGGACVGILIDVTPQLVLTFGNLFGRLAVLDTDRISQ